MDLPQIFQPVTCFAVDNLFHLLKNGPCFIENPRSISGLTGPEENLNKKIKRNNDNQPVTCCRGTGHGQGQQEHASVLTSPSVSHLQT